MRRNTEVTIKFMSIKIGRGSSIRARKAGLQLFLVVRTGSGNNDLFRGDDQGTLCGSAAIEHLLNHRFEGFNGIHEAEKWTASA